MFEGNREVTKMKVAQKVIFLMDGGDGLSTSIYDGLHPNRSSNFQTLNESFELSLERYGIKDRKASGQIVHYVNDDGLSEVSVLLLQTYEPPILACALNEVLSNLGGDDLSTMPALIAPFLVPQLKLKSEKYLMNSNKVSIYGIKLGPPTNVTQALSSKLQKLQPSVQVYDEGLALFLQLVKVMKIPTAVLIGQSSQQASHKTSIEDIQVIQEIGTWKVFYHFIFLKRESCRAQPRFRGISRRHGEHYMDNCMLNQAAVADTEC